MCTVLFGEEVGVWGGVGGGGGGLQGVGGGGGESTFFEQWFLINDSITELRVHTHTHARTSHWPTHGLYHFSQPFLNDTLNTKGGERKEEGEGEVEDELLGWLVVYHFVLTG